MWFKKYEYELEFVFNYLLVVVAISLIRTLLRI